MSSKPIAVGLLMAICVTAAAGGAYVAIRQNSAEAAAGAAVHQAAAPVASPSPFDATQGKPAVRETEAVVTPQAAAPEPALERPAAPSVTATPTIVKTQRPQARTKAAQAKRVSSPARRVSSPAQPATPTAGVAMPPVDAAPTSGRPETTPIPEAPPVEAARAEAPPSAPTRIFDELEVPASSVIGLQIETPVSTERARVEDRVEARVLRDVRIDGRTAIPAGARAVGAVTLVERGGKMKERARLGVRFHTLVLADGTELPIRTDPILREGDSPSGDSARKIGGAAVGGAILGALIGGKKGAVIGGATGAAGGSAVVMAGDRNAATLPVGAVVTVRLSAPMTVEVERREQ
jgi:hypothetical protein